jgi:subtilase family serine protease
MLNPITISGMCMVCLLLLATDLLTKPVYAQTATIHNNSPHSQTQSTTSSTATTFQAHIVPIYQDNKPIRQKLPCLRKQDELRCFTPQQIARAYNIQPLQARGITGKGQSIAIIDFYQNPYVQTDLQTFNQYFGLKPAQLHIYAPLGLKPFNPFNPQQIASALEIDLDVEWAHAIAPDATLNLILAPSPNFGQVVQVTRYAVDHNLGDVLSQSFGAPETCLEPELVAEDHVIFERARAKGISVFASAGDQGVLVPVCSIQKKVVRQSTGVAYPASDPAVMAVGGTTLKTSRHGDYISERVWSNVSNILAGGSTGGGFSRLFPRPAYQAGIPGTQTLRGIPDIAYDANTITGFPVVTETLFSGVPSILPVGGTSAGTPQWAAIATLLNQFTGKDLGQLNSLLYQISTSEQYKDTFHDITVGNNNYEFLGLLSRLVVIGYKARPHWDPTTGIGTPRTFELAQKLQSLLIQNRARLQHHQHAPQQIHAGLQPIKQLPSNSKSPSYTKKQRQRQPVHHMPHTHMLDRRHPTRHHQTRHQHRHYAPHPQHRYHAQHHQHRHYAPHHYHHHNHQRMSRCNCA